MVSSTPNEGFQLWEDNESPWEHRTDFTKLDNIFGGSRSVSAISAEKVYTVGGQTMADINTAVDNHNHVILEPGVTYTGSTTIDITRTGENIVLDGRFSKLNGSGVVVDIDAQNSFSSSSMEGSVTVLLGGVQSDAAAGSRCIRVTDSENVTLEVGVVRNAEEGVEFRNETRFCENMTVTIGDSDTVDATLALRGQSTTGGSGGTDSFRRARIDIQGHVNDGGTVYLEETADTYASDIRVSAFVSGTGGNERTGLQLEGTVSKTIYRPLVEFAGGTGEGVGIVEGTNGISGAGMIMAPDFRGLATNYDVTSASLIELRPVAAGLEVWDPVGDVALFEVSREGADGVRFHGNVANDIGNQVDTAGFTASGGFDIQGVTDTDPTTAGDTNDRWIKCQDPDGNAFYLRGYR